LMNPIRAIYGFFGEVRGTGLSCSAESALSIATIRGGGPDPQTQSSCATASMAPTILAGPSIGGDREKTRLVTLRLLCQSDSFACAATKVCGHTAQRAEARSRLGDQREYSPVVALRVHQECRGFLRPLGLRCRMMSGADPPPSSGLDRFPSPTSQGDALHELAKCSNRYSIAGDGGLFSRACPAP
jgi:hypothetical protein